MNCYADLTRIKSRLDITSTTYDTDLLMLLNAASRAIDNYCHRFFYTEARTWYFDGQSSPAFFGDILAITTLKTDEDGDATYENSYTDATDYWKYPINGFPYTHLVINPTGSYGGFASGMRHAVEIEGFFGYGDGKSATPYSDSGDEVESDPLSSSATSCTVNDADNFAAGQTILVEEEQCYVSAINSTTNIITITRAVNGTTAASHVQDTSIYIYQYPDTIIEATLIQAMRWWKRRESAFQDMVGSAEVGQLIAYKGLDADIKLIIESFKRRVMA